MQFILSNPKTRKLMLFGGLGGVIIAAFIIFFFGKFSSLNQTGILDGSTPTKSGISENLVEKIGKNITEMQEELQNDFYKGLRKHSWTLDSAKAGRVNPFIK